VISVAIVAGGTAAGHIFSMLLSPVLTRLYSPSAMGLLGIFLSVVSILSTVTCLAYGHAIALPGENRKAIALLHLSLRIDLVITLIVALAYYFFSGKVTDFLRLQELGMGMWLMPVIVFLAGMRMPSNQWLIRQKNFKLIGKLTVFQSLFSGLLNIIGGIFWANAITLVVTYSLGHLIYDFWLLMHINKEIQALRQDEHFDLPSEMKLVAKEYSDFPFYRAPQIFLNSISHSLPMLAFGVLFEPAIAGFYSIGNRVLQLPGSLVTQSLGTVILPELAQTARKRGNLQKQILKSTKFLALAGIIPFSLIFFQGPSLFALVFGISWQQAGVYASWLTLQLYCGFINVPAVQALALTKSQGFLLAWEVITTFGKLLAILIGAYYWKSPEIAVACYSIFGAAAYLVLIFFSIIRAGNKENLRN
jgi:O-antigen/teichoic acid export membrane protein